MFVLVEKLVFIKDFFYYSFFIFYDFCLKVFLRVIDNFDMFLVVCLSVVLDKDCKYCKIIEVIFFYKVN